MQSDPAENPVWPTGWLLHSGLQSGGWNARFDRTWLKLHAAGERPGLLRFYRSLPTVSLGRHQALELEVRTDYCQRKHIEIVRRASGGGALYLDPDQLGFSLITRRPAAWENFGLEQMLAAFCAAIADSLALLGVAAAFKAPNDLQIDGRKLASAFIAVEGDILLLQASLLCDVDIQTLLEALRVPTEKLTVTGLESARQRLATLREVLGEIPPDAVLQEALQVGLAGALGLSWTASPLGIGASLDVSASRPDQVSNWSDLDDSALEGLHKTPGGTLRARLWPDADRQRISRIGFAGDFHLHPADALDRLQQSLAGLRPDEAESAVSDFFDRHPCELPGFSSSDIRTLLRITLDKLTQQETMGLSASQANRLMVAGEGNAEAILARASVMLLPYCAKPAWCKWRSQDDCVECGKCKVGDAYRLARERNMQVTTITHYEHLTATLAEMKQRQVDAYVGACCSQFFIKRNQAFAEAGMGAVLMDISGANCYELKQEEAAYAGQFQAEAELDGDLLERVMLRVPALPDEQPLESVSPIREAARSRTIIPLIPITEKRKHA